MKLLSRRGKIIVILLIASVTILVGMVSYIYYRSHYNPDNQKIQEIETYLDKISPQLLDAERTIADQRKIQSWGCGPSSYALAVIINKKFFDNNLPINVAYDNNPREIVQRFGFAEYKDATGQLQTIDHVWLEIYIGDKIIYVDPTIAYFGATNKIAHEFFRIGDPNFRQILKDKYNIIDNRLSRLVKKALTKIPIDQNPYPGIAIDPRDLPYYVEVGRIRDIVNLGYEPPEWKDWVDTITSKFL